MPVSLGTDGGYDWKQQWYRTRSRAFAREVGKRFDRGDERLVAVAKSFESVNIGRTPARWPEDYEHGVFFRAYMRACGLRRNMRMLHAITAVSPSTSANIAHYMAAGGNLPALREWFDKLPSSVSRPHILESLFLGTTGRFDRDVFEFARLRYPTPGASEISNVGPTLFGLAYALHGMIVGGVLLDDLKWLWRDHRGAFLEAGALFGRDLIAAAVAAGRLDVAGWLLACRIRPGANCWRLAIECDSPHRALDWLLGVEPLPDDEGLVGVAYDLGQTSALDWLRERGCNMQVREQALHAAQHALLPLLVWFREHWPRVVEENCRGMVAGAIEEDSLRCLIWLRDEGLWWQSVDEMIAAARARRPSGRVLRWLVTCYST